MPKKGSIDQHWVRAYAVGRKCTSCDAPLSRYNSESTCHACQEAVPLRDRPTSPQKLTGHHRW